MNKFNAKMFDIFVQKIKSDNRFSGSLSAILANGFSTQHGCYLLSAFYQNNLHISLDSFVDKTGYECFINSFHIDDFVDEDFFEQSVLFIDALLNKWRILNNDLVLNIILSKTDFGFNIRFHVHREGEEWINMNDLVFFEDALLVISSKEYIK